MQVALFTRAWIEIDNCDIVTKDGAVALFTRAWIEITPETLARTDGVCRPLHEGVD